MRAALLILTLSLAGCANGPGSVVVPQVAMFLSAAPPTLVIEFDHVEGFEPNQGAVDELVRALRANTDKADIRVELATMPRRGNLVEPYRWTDDKLRAAADATLDPRTDPDAAVIHVLYVDGTHRERDLAGIAIGYEAFLFEPDNDLFRLGLGRLEYERSVLIHEVGHVIGLVDFGAPMVRPHAKSDDPIHSANPNSVMWAGIDSYEAAFSTIGAGKVPPYRFDADDKADLAAVRELARAALG